MFRICIAMITLASCFLMLHSASPLSYGQNKEKEKKSKKKDPASPVQERLDKGAEEVNRALFTFDPGSHTRPISAMGFGADETKLITVGTDYSIQIWDTKTGERLDIFRLPAYGRDNGIDVARWGVAAVSPDGRYVAIGGAPKLLWNDNRLTRLIFVDLEKRRVRKYNVNMDPRASIECMAFAQSGNRLIVGTSGSFQDIYVIDDIPEYMQMDEGQMRPSPPKQVGEKFTTNVSKIAISPDGTKCVATDISGNTEVWNIEGKLSKNWKQITHFHEKGRTDALRFSPKGDTFVRSTIFGVAGDNRKLEIRDLKGKIQKSWLQSDLTPGLISQNLITDVRYLSETQLFLACHGAVNPREGYGTVSATLDIPSGKCTRLIAKGGLTVFAPCSDIGIQKGIAAISSSCGLEVLIFQLSDGKLLCQCGDASQIPLHVAWGTKEAPHSIAWSIEKTRAIEQKKLEKLTYHFDLQQIEPKAQGDIQKLTFSQHVVDDWSLEEVKSETYHGNLVKNAKQKIEYQIGNHIAETLVPQGNKPPRVAVSHRNSTADGGEGASLLDEMGKTVVDFYPRATKIDDIVASPDGRYILLSTGTHRVSIYPTDGSKFPILNLVYIRGEWVIWTTEGYYASSPGGDKFIGWAITNGANDFVTYYPAERFSKHYHRPDIIAKVLEYGSVKLALEKAKVVPKAVDANLPPTATITKINQKASEITVQVQASSGNANKPITSMRILLDGRPLSEQRGIWTAEAGKESKAVFTIPIPGGKHELRVLAKTDDSSTLSDALTVQGVSNVRQPTLHRLCVGINDYDDINLKLNAAVKDAQNIYSALEQHCVGAENRFQKVSGEIILDKEATVANVLQAVKNIRTNAKPGDMAVLFFACHGVKDENQFYILTRESNINQDLSKVALSGEALSQELAKVQCPVLLIFDACHSARITSAFRPATDALTRKLANEDVGITVMAAAMSYETAGATQENGYFTAALVKGLQAVEGVPFDPYDHRMYVHHLYSFAYSEVRKATNGSQNPFLNMPWTSPPLAVRKVGR